MRYAKSFDGLTFSKAGQRVVIDESPRASAVISSRNTASLYGSGIVPRSMTKISVAAKTSSTWATLLDDYGDWSGKLGVTGRLTVGDPDDTIERWCDATLSKLPFNQSAMDYRLWRSTMEFVQQSPTWNGTQQIKPFTLASGTLNNRNLPNDGNVTVENAVITVTAGTNNLVFFQITGDGIDIQYDGTVSAGNDLVIDCGAWSVTNDGVNDYKNFSLGSGHTHDQWLPILPDGGITVNFTRNGGGSTTELEINYYDGWRQA